MARTSEALAHTCKNDKILGSYHLCLLWAYRAYAKMTKFKIFVKDKHESSY